MQSSFLSKKTSLPGRVEMRSLREKSNSRNLVQLSMRKFCEIKSRIGSPSTQIGRTSGSPRVIVSKVVMTEPSQPSTVRRGTLALLRSKCSDQLIEFFGKAAKPRAFSNRMSIFGHTGNWPNKHHFEHSRMENNTSSSFRPIGVESGELSRTLLGLSERDMSSGHFLTTNFNEYFAGRRPHRVATLPDSPRKILPLSLSKSRGKAIENSPDNISSFLKAQSHINGAIVASQFSQDTKGSKNQLSSKNLISNFVCELEPEPGSPSLDSSESDESLHKLLSATEQKSTTKLNNRIQESRKLKLKELLVAKFKNQSSKNLSLHPKTLNNLKSQIRDESFELPIPPNKLVDLCKKIKDQRRIVSCFTVTHFEVCPLISIRKFPRSIFFHKDISSDSSENYRSYWMDCIDVLLSSQNILLEDPGYYAALLMKVNLDCFPKVQADFNDDGRLEGCCSFMNRLNADLDYAHLY